MLLEFIFSRPFRALIVTYAILFPLDWILNQIFSQHSTIAVFETTIIMVFTFGFYQLYKHTRQQLLEFYVSIPLDHEVAAFYHIKHRKLIRKFMFVLCIFQYYVILTVLSIPYGLNVVSFEVVATLVGIWVFVLYIRLLRKITNQANDDCAQAAGEYNQNIQPFDSISSVDHKDTKNFELM